MQKLRTILAVCPGDNPEKSSGIRRAFALARDHKAAVTLLLIHTDFPEEHESLKLSFREFLTDTLRTAVDVHRRELDLKESDVPLTVLVQEAGYIPPAITIIRHVLEHSFDLVIKDAEPVEGGRGFRGADMTLLRKCPCAVWLARPAGGFAETMRIGVAIDPESREPGEKKLSLNLLRAAGSLAAGRMEMLDIISCWEYELEKILRYKAWVNIPEEELRRNAEEYRRDHFALLETLVGEANMEEGHHIHHLKGRAEDVIPEFTQRRGTNLLVMGTIARTGIPGFLIGNTAENILEKTACSLLALKPPGYVSPVRPA